jgi:hypothetical protein
MSAAAAAAAAVASNLNHSRPVDGRMCRVRPHEQTKARRPAVSSLFRYETSAHNNAVIVRGLMVPGARGKTGSDVIRFAPAQHAHRDSVEVKPQ